MYLKGRKITIWFTNSHSLSPNVLQNFVLVVVVCAVLVRTSLEAVLLYAGQQGKCLVWKEGELSTVIAFISSCRHVASPLQRKAENGNFYLSFMIEENRGLFIGHTLLSTANKYVHR